MQTNVIPVKTERGRLALRGHGFAGSRAQRALLIMVDGRHTVDRLAPAMASLGLSWNDLQHMADAGWLAWHGTGPADSPPLAQTPPAPAAPDEPDTIPQPALEVAEAVLIGLEHTRRLLGDADLPLRDAASRLHDAAGLHRWLAMAADTIEVRLGAGAAADFRHALMSRLDEDLLAVWPASGGVDIPL